MGIANKVQNNFASGQLSPKVWGRYELPIYHSGCEVIRNFIPEVQGGVKFRTGSVYVNHTRLNQEAILIPFQFSDEQAYILEFSNLMMRVHKDDGVVLEADKTITDITSASPAVVTSTAHGYADGDEVFISGVVGMTGVNGSFYLVANKTANTFEITDIDGAAIDTSASTPYASGGVADRIYEVVSPYPEAVLFEMKFAQNADTKYVAHKLYPPTKITRSGHTSWTINNAYTRTADPFGSAGNYPGAVAFYEGRLFWLSTTNNPESFWGSKAPGSGGTPLYDDYTLGLNPDDAILYTLAPVQGKVDTGFWLMGNAKFLGAGTFGGVTQIDGGSADTSITPTSVRVRPADGFGCANLAPIYGGSGEIIYIQRGNLGVKSLEYDYKTDSYQPVDRNLISDNITSSGVTQLVFAQGRPTVLWATKNDGKLIGVTYKAKEDVTGWHAHDMGGTDAKVLSVGSTPRSNNHDRVWLVVERTINGMTRRSVEYFADHVDFKEPEDFYSDAGNESEDRERWTRDMFQRQKESIHVDSCVTFDGFQRSLSASATLVPSALTGNSITFTASASIFTASDIGNQVRKASIEGVGKGIATIVSYVSGTQVTCNILEDFDSLDATIAGSWAITAKTLSGLQHLEGESVSLAVDGGQHPNKVVVDGSITLDYEAEKAHIGLGYVGIIKTVNIETGGNSGPGQSRTKKLIEARLKFHQSLGVTFGSNIYRGQDVILRSAQDNTNRPPPLFSGYKEVHLPNDYDLQSNVFILQKYPLPCTVSQLDLTISVSD